MTAGARRGADVTTKVGSTIKEGLQYWGVHGDTSFHPNTLNPKFLNPTLDPQEVFWLPLGDEVCFCGFTGFRGLGFKCIPRARGTRSQKHGAPLHVNKII